MKLSGLTVRIAPVCGLAAALLLNACTVSSGRLASRRARSASPLGEYGGSGGDLIKQNEAKAMYKLRTIATAEESYSAENVRYVKLEELLTNNYIMKESASPESDGYRFIVAVSADGLDFAARATPIRYGETGRLSFFVDRENLVRGADKQGAQATSDDPPASKPPSTIEENESAAIHKLRAFAIAETMVFSEQMRYCTLEEMSRQHVLKGEFAMTESDGYRFSLRVSDDFQSFSAVAVPLLYGTTGVHSFFVDKRTIVRSSDRNGAEARASDPPLQ